MKTINICSVDNCNDKVKAYGHCQKHALRLKKHGSLDKPIKGNGRSSHPLYTTWVDLKKRKELCEDWQDFWKFLAVVGERPGNNFNFEKLEESQLFSSTNFYWQERLVRKQDESPKEWNARRWAARVKNYPALNCNAKIYKYLGLSIKKYNILVEGMFEKQNNLCVICRNPETGKHKNDKSMRLALDHCHTTMKVRELLCLSCNHGIGLMEDSVPLMQKTIQYLEKYFNSPRNFKYSIKNKWDFFYRENQIRNDLCEICRKSETRRDKNGNLLRLSVDHCHTTNNIRGLVCFRCNVALGKAKDSIPLLQSMIKYIEKHSF